MVRLYQFPFSHFCEKARWALDMKRVPYSVVNLLPGLHMKPVKRLAPRTCVPVLIDGGTVVQDSPEIISYLDHKHPESLLTPSEPALASEALEWERYLDQEVGVPLRCWFYYHTLPQSRAALGFLLQDAPWHLRALFRVIFPKVREKMLAFMKIDERTAADAERRLSSALDRLDATLADRRFLVGDRFSRADLIACALLSPCVMASEAQIDQALVAPVREFRDRMQARRCFRWVQDTYAEYRNAKRKMHP